jgi:glycosyltransferase involved in cell wall biosynthesis
MRLYYIVLNEMLTGIVPSQVIAPARVYTAAMPGVSTRIIFLEPARVAFSRLAHRRLRELRELWPDGRITICPYVGRLGKSSPARFLSVYLRARGTNKDKIVFHCRGPEATIQTASVAKRLDGRVVFDARGASDHEAVLRLTNQGRGDDIELLRRAFNNGARVDRIAVEQASATVAVSEPLAGKLSEAIEGEKETINVIPCCIETAFFSSVARREIRSRLGLADGELLLAHVSSEARWEDFEQVIAFFRAVRRRRRARMMFLTRLDASVVTSGIAGDDPIRESLIVKNARFAEVPQYLSAADVGLLLRKPHESFRVASPIKFSEYLGAGLAVVASEGIGNTAELVESRRIGIGVPANPDASAIEDSAGRLLSVLDQGPDPVRQAILETCREIYLWERYTPVIARIYGYP